ncbi:MAG: acyltransferase family protein [Clostridia bacterium]|nr:acyltransferase family protein [Clostridia bacterium]
MNGKMNLRNGHIDYPDALRAVACLAVVMLHVSAANTYNVDFLSREYHVFMAYESAVNWAVPVFVMISGALLLNREYDYKSISGRCGRLALIFLAWSLLYLGFDLLVYGPETYKDMLWLQVLLQGHYHMWYLIMLAGLYLLVPILKVIADRTEFRKAFIALSLIFAFALPAVRDLALLSGAGKVLQVPLFGALFNALKNVHDDLNFHFTVGYAAYFVIGSALARSVKPEGYRALGTGIALAAAGTVLTYLEIRSTASKEAAARFLLYYQPGVFLQACGVFLALKGLSGSGIVTGLSKLSPVTFGIYMVHPMIIEGLQKMNLSSLSFNPFVSVPVLSLGIFAVSGAAAYLLKLTPLRRIMKIGGK